MSSTIQKSHSSRFVEYIEQDQPEAAYTRAEAFLLQADIDPNELIQICSYLDRLLPRLSTDQTENFLQLMLKALQKFPAFAREQAHALTRYGELFSSKKDSLSAMRCFAIAHALEPLIESAQMLVIPLLPFIYKGLEIQLQKAVGRGNPTHFQQLMTQFTEKFGSDLSTIQQIYQIADRVYKEITNPNTKAQFTHLLDEIEDGVEGRIIPQATPLPYRNHLQQVRKGFESQLEIRLYQKERAEAFCNFFQKLFQDALFILGEPPCKYDIRAMGSLAREEVCPYSDLEYFILIEEEQHRPYFQKLAKIFDLQILSLGETDPKHQELFNFGQKFGLEIDHQANPATHNSLIGRPEQLFALPQEPSPDDLKAYKSRLRSVSLQRNHEFDLPEPTLDVRVLLEMRKEEFASLKPLQSTICEVKREFVEPLFHLISDLGLHFSLEESNTLDLIENLPLFTPLSKELLKTAASDLYRLRVRLHLAHGGIYEEASLIPSLELTTLTDQEKESLRRVHELVLIPLYQLNLDEQAQELLNYVHQTPEVVEQIGTLLQQAPIEIHRAYYQKLGAPDQRELRACYLKLHPHHNRALSEIPNRAGYRHSRQLEEERFTLSLQRVTTDTSASGVKIRSPLVGERYLTEEASKALIDRHGHIYRNYEDSLHRVSSFQDLHFKELPYQPLMEYAIYSLWHRIMGRATPLTTLARIEVPSKKLVYPVIISETIQGQKIDHPSRLNPEHLTWMRLCEILTKPGDGRFSNYLLRLGKIYCIDNDISFMEPVAKTKGQRKVTFCSSLFTLDIPLVPEVLTQFCALEPDLILTDWLEELQEQERRYCSLFSEAELQTFYTQDKDRRFSPTLMLAKGTIATLCMQFYHLQDVLRQNTFTDPSLLLRELITLEGSTQNQVGPLVERQYRKALSLPLPKRLEAATAIRTDQSMTSQKAMELNYKKIPTFEEIQRREAYSLEEALKELCLLEAQKLWNQVFVIQNGEEYSLEADFSALEDPEREKMILRGLQFLYASKEQKPTSLTLRHTQTLTFPLLKPLLHAKLRSLDLSYSHINKLTGIEELSPNIEEIYLKKCPHIKKIAFNLTKLRILDVSHNLNLTSLKVNSKFLEKLQFNFSPNLKKIQTSLSIETDVDWNEVAPVKNPEFLAIVYQFGTQYAEGNNVPIDHERATSFWTRAASGGHLEAREILKWKNLLDETVSFDRSGKMIQPRNFEKPSQIYPQIEKQQCLALAQALKINTTLKDLNLSCNLLDDAVIVALGDAFRVNNTLEKIDLGSNHCEDKGAAAIAQAIRNSRTLSTLNLRENWIGVQGSQDIAEAVKRNQILRHLDLSWIKGGTELVNTIRYNQTLTRLNLSGCEIEILLLSEVIKDNHSLIDLYLCSIKKLGEMESASLIDALKYNHTLITLNLQGSYGDSWPTYELTQQAYAFLERNRSLRDSALQSAGSGKTQLFTFIDQGVSPYSQDEEENTFLHLAAAHGHMHLIQPLLERSQNPTFPSWKNDAGKTALDLAREKGHTAIVELLSSQK